MEVEHPVGAVSQPGEVDEQAAEEYWRPAFAILLEEGRRDIDNQPVS
jgi:hypothetical protein